MKYLYIIIFLVFPFFASGQDCYKTKSDFTGSSRIEKLEKLEESACQLNASFPSKFQSKFKVYDFGMYHYNNLMEGDYDNIWNEFLSSIPNDNFYLAFGRHSNPSNLMRVELKLPNEDEFSCLTDVERNNVKSSIEFAMRSVIEQSANSYDLDFQAQMHTMFQLEKLIVEIVNCCDTESRSGCSICTPSDDFIEDFLLSENFSRVDISVTVDGPLLLNKDDIKNSTVRNSVIVEDIAGLQVNYDGDVLDIVDKLESNISNFISSGDDVKIYIIKNSNICDGVYDSLNIVLDNRSPFLTGFLYVKDNFSDNDELYFRLEGLLHSEIEGLNAYSIGELEESVSGGIGSFQELVQAVKEAEDSLINNGFEEIEDRIHMIRGIYYGTTWSMDYGQMESTGRNLGFNVFTASPEPVDPRPFIGDDLFNLLVNSPEVIDNGKGFDWGHAIIGLDARRKFASRGVNFPPTGSTGLEIVTWIGDLGGGAGKLAWDRINSPNTRAKSKFLGSHFGGATNIEGNIAGYLIGREEDTVFSAPDMALTDDDYIADELKKYLIDNENNDWDNRVQLFLQMIAGNVINDSAKEYLAEKIASFGEVYLIQRKKDGESFSMKDATAHLDGAAEEITDIFIHTLENSSNLSATYDPDPSPKGEPYMKYKAAEKFNNIKEKIKDWFKN